MYMCVFVWVCEYVGTGALRVLKRLLDLLELELRVGCEQPTWVLGTKRVLCKCSRCSSQLSHSSRTAGSPLFSLSV